MSFDPFERCVKDEMTKAVVWIDGGDSLLNALRRMDDDAVNALPVTDDQERCVGILSAADIIETARSLVEPMSKFNGLDAATRAAEIERVVDNRLSHVKVRDVMTHEVKAVRPDTPIAEAGRQMLRRRVHHLPVVDEGERLVGIVSTLDLLAAFVKAAPT